MNRILIQNAKIVNEGKTTEGDVLIEGNYITQIGSSVSAKPNTKVIDAKGKHLIPGVIDDQVHFREPGLTHKGTIETGSRAAAAGGITSFFEMPNTIPQATTQEELEKKFQRAAETSYINYSFAFGGTNDNLEELLKTDPKTVSGIKLFLGSSTGNMLVDNEKVLEKIFSSTELVISAHCEDEETVRANLKKHIEQYGDDIPIEKHPIIRSEEACYISSSNAVALAKKTGARLHVFHLTTAKEMELFRNDIPLKDKKITAEVCLHHLWFCDEDYKEKGTLIKWNPAIKTAKDRAGLWEALLDDRIDVIASDHAPHLLSEKQQPYTKAPSGAPLVQHSLVAMLECVHQNKISMEKMVEKMCHNPAILFDIYKRGYIREGYYADLVLVDTNNPWNVQKDNILYKCSWSPLEGTKFQSKVTHTFVNGNLIYDQGVFNHDIKGMRIAFDR